MELQSSFTSSGSPFVASDSLVLFFQLVNTGVNLPCPQPEKCSETAKTRNRHAPDFRFFSSSRLSAGDVDACFREFDKDGDKKLNYDEFCLMMNTRRHTLELLLEHHRSIDESPSSNHAAKACPGGSKAALYMVEGGSDTASVTTQETNVDI